MMDKEKLNKMKTYSFLLPDPGGEVVRECIDKIEALEAENATLHQQNAELVEALEGLYSHTKNNHVIHGLNAKAKAALDSQPT
jgi:uncharacterized protein (UPF0335 family)